MNNSDNIEDTNTNNTTYTHTILRATNPELRKQGKEFINTYHSYIKFSDRPSRKLYWNLYENGEMVGVFALGSAFSHSKIVKEYMINNNLQFNEVANNIVYCLANCENKNAGTQLLSLVRKDAIKWWYERYGDYLKAFQTFILPPRIGAIYKADNWNLIGETIGNSQKTKNIRPDKIDQYKNVQKKTFKDGRVEYCIYIENKVEPKLIFMKLVKDKELKRILGIKNI